MSATVLDRPVASEPSPVPVPEGSPEPVAAPIGDPDPTPSAPEGSPAPAPDTEPTPPWAGFMAFVKRHKKALMIAAIAL